MNIEEKILNIILNSYEQDFIDTLYSELNIDDINIFDDLTYDSIKFIQLVIDLEEIFNIEVADDMLLMENFSTIKQIKDLIINLTGDKMEFGEETYEK